MNSLIGYENLIVSAVAFLGFLIFGFLVFLTTDKENRMIYFFFSIGAFTLAFERWLVGEAFISEATEIDLILREKIIIASSNVVIIACIAGVLLVGYKKLKDKGYD